MNNLDILKQKMMIKPIVHDRELVAVLIKGAKNKTNRTVEPSLQADGAIEQGKGENVEQSVSLFLRRKKRATLNPKQ